MSVKDEVEARLDLPPPVSIFPLWKKAVGALQKSVNRNIRVEPATVGEIRHVWQDHLCKIVLWTIVLFQTEFVKHLAPIY